MRNAKDIAGFPANEKLPWQESHLQEAVATYLSGLRLARLLDFQHAPLEGKRSWAAGKKLKKAGMAKGHPDFDIYLPGGKTVFVELKTSKESLRPEQRERHAALQRLGFPVYTVKGKSPRDAVGQVSSILQTHGAGI